MSARPTPANAAAACCRIWPQLTIGPGPGSTPSSTFSITVRSGAIDSSW